MIYYVVHWITDFLRPPMNLETWDFARLENESIKSFMSLENLSSSSTVGRSSDCRRDVSSGKMIMSTLIHGPESPRPALNGD